MAVEKDQAFVEYVAKELVEKPEKVQVKRSVDEMGVLIELTVDKEDMGVIIGKEGKTAKAIRTLLRVLGAKNDARVNLKIVEPEGSERPVKEETPAAEEAAPADAEEAPAKDSEPAESAQEESSEQIKEDDFVEM
jgi:predicted RNA-binding protein YlqC (UPF0109 family)